jgi:UDP-glucose 4-epimerase
MRTCLVTGGAGFIGSHIVRKLLERGDRVRVLDNFSTGKRENLAEMESSIEIIEADLRDPEHVAKAVDGVEIVFHQAAFVSVPLSVENPQACFDTNVHGVEMLLQAAQKTSVRRVVTASSAAVYGESQDYPLRETGETMSLSPYAASKRVNEIYADLYTRTTEMGVTALRYFNVYGPRQSPASDYAAVIPIFIHRLLEGKAARIHGDGLQSRDFVFVEDIARANLIAADRPQAAGEIINICSGEEITILDILNTLREIIPDTPEPAYGPPRPGDIYRSVGDPSRAERILNFRPRTGLDEGLRETVDWMRS